MEPLLADGLRKVQSGATSLEEILRVAGTGD
jgi:type II secretory ATPase GspE/PulE/Tfp pilus assembly ATPase PilB-like protein